VPFAVDEMNLKMNASEMSGQKRQAQQVPDDDGGRHLVRLT
jgi:hypothetical protein